MTIIDTARRQQFSLLPTEYVRPSVARSAPISDSCECSLRDYCAGHKTPYKGGVTGVAQAETASVKDET